MTDQYYYEYEDTGEYYYPGTLVLVNRLNIRDASELHDVERNLTALNMIQMVDEPVIGALDFKHLKSIHKAIFGDMYAWAGLARTVNIAKGNRFCDSAYIETYAKELFNQLNEEAYLTATAPSLVASRLAYYLGEINVLHPFREGNGRTQRVMIEYIAKVAGFEISFANVTGKEMIQASAEAFNREYSLMTSILERVMRPMAVDEQADFVSRLTKKRGPVYLAWHKKQLK